MARIAPANAMINLFSLVITSQNLALLHGKMEVLLEVVWNKNGMIKKKRYQAKNSSEQ